MELHAFGSMAMCGPEGSARINSRKQRIVLGALLVELNTVVPTDRLVELAWPDGSSVDVHPVISRLRRMMRSLGMRSRIETRPPGYVLHADAEDVDVAHFESLVERAKRAAAEGRLTSSRSLFEAAHATWIGEPFSDVDAAFATGEARRLTELKWQAIDLQLQVDLDLGRHQLIADVLPRLIREQPLRESLRFKHMIALHRSGRSAEALMAYAEARERLVDELGVEPGADLHGLYLNVLAGQPLPVDARPAMRRRPPMPSVALIGRDADVHRVLELIAQEQVVTLHGPGGVGKSALARAVIQHLPGSVDAALVDLDDIHNVNDLPAVIGAAAGLDGVRNLAQLANVLGDSPLLLVLDNCEHLKEAVAQLVSAISHACPHVTVLAASRRVLELPHEAVFAVHALRGGVEGDASALFHRQAARAMPSWDPSREDEVLVEEVCGLVGGLPLGIELAAAQLRILSLQQLRDHLAGKQDGLLPAGLPLPHGAMSAVITRSYDLLQAPEHSALRALSFLEGPFDLLAARVITDDHNIMTLLSVLADHSLLQVEQVEPRRYRILEPVRQFLARELSSGEHATLSARLIAHVRSLASIADERLRGRDSAAWMLRIRNELGNIRKALDLTSDPVDTLFILNGVYWYWFRRGNVDDLRSEYRRLLGPLAAAPASERDGSSELLRGHVAFALLSYLAGDAEEIFSSLERASALLADSDDYSARAQATSAMAFFSAAAGLADEALTLAASSTELARTVGSHLDEAVSVMCEGMALYRLGNMDAADDVLERAIKVADAAGYAWCGVSARWLRCKVWLNQADKVAQALVLAREMIDMSAAESDVTSWLVSVETLAYAAYRLGRLEAASELVGIVAKQSEAHGFDPLSMDPVDLARYRAAVQEHVVLDARQMGEAQSWRGALERVSALATELLRAAVTPGDRGER